MKKIGLIILASLVLVGCSGRGSALYEEKVKLYQSYWSTILDQNKYQSSSNNFSIHAVMNPVEGKYQYDVIVDKARVAMYDIDILVLENDDPYHDEKMMPSLGIFNDATYHLIPNQSRPEKDYQTGFKLSGESDESQLTLYIMVSWKNYSQNTTFKEYFELNVE